MVIVLEVQAGPSLGKSIRVPEGQSLRVGRNPRSDVAFVRDAYMSGTHFSVECGDAACSINDLNSRNGTFVNGEKVEKTFLHDGDTVVAGSTLLAVRLYAGDSVPPPPAGAEQGMSASDAAGLAEFHPETAEAERPDLTSGPGKTG
jgi:pSer/pThr/pTyr-binding forkhead associated (FHA) protein